MQTMTEQGPRASRGGDGGWRDGAVCRETDPELFFPTAAHGRVYEVQVAAAKAVCARCPVRAECLIDALAGMPVGIAGGLTEGERRALRRRRRERGEPVAAGWPATERDRARELLARGGTVAEVARRCGVTPRTVERWKADDRAEARRVAGPGPSVGSVAS